MSNEDNENRPKKLVKKLREVQILSSVELAQYLGVPEATVAKWRATDQGPAYFRAGKYVRYKMSSVQTWIRRNEVGGRNRLRNKVTTESSEDSED